MSTTTYITSTVGTESMLDMLGGWLILIGLVALALAVLFTVIFAKALGQAKNMAAVDDGEDRGSAVPSGWAKTAAILIIVLGSLGLLSALSGSAYSVLAALVSISAIVLGSIAISRVGGSHGDRAGWSRVAAWFLLIAFAVPLYLTGLGALGTGAYTLIK